MRSHDYDNYGAFKQSTTNGEAGLKAFARRIGLQNRYLRFVKHLPKDGTIVEVGCGDGSFMRELRSAGFRNVNGVDLSASYADAEGVHIGDAADYLSHFPAASLDAVIAMDVFEHVPQDDLRALLRIAREKLKVGRGVIFRVPNMGSPLAMTNQFGDLSHVNAFNEVSVRQIAFDVGLIVEAVHPEPRAYPRSILALVGLTVWPIYKLITKSVLASFGVRQAILTPNLVAVLRVPEADEVLLRS